MPITEWLFTWYAWIPPIVLWVLLTILWSRESPYKREVCPTCYSAERRVRYTVRYWISDYLYNDSPCEDEWHGKS